MEVPVDASLTAPLPPQDTKKASEAEELAVRAVESPRSDVWVLSHRKDGRRQAFLPDNDSLEALDTSEWNVEGILPGVFPEWLGDPGFADRHGVRFPYVVGEMANGIATTDMVVAAARGGFLGVFGAAGLTAQQVEEALGRIRRELGPGPGWAVNLIHSPTEPAVERAVVELLLRERVPSVSVSAFMELTPSVLRLALSGISERPDGSVHRPVRVLAKVSRPETAKAFMTPAPAALLEQLVGRGLLNKEEARLAARVPVAEDITAEADSGGHTDNRPLTALLPRLLALRDSVARVHGYTVRVGAAGGLGTPHALAAAFAAGAAYAVTGSVNQTTRESGISEQARALLAAADLPDMVMAPAADMFELGVKVQVLGKGTMFAQRARLLHRLYDQYDSLDQLDEKTRRRLERDIFRAPLADIWEQTEKFWSVRDQGEIERAASDPKHRMALLFRWYLGQSSHWAIRGEQGRAVDFQLWCGPALGAFNHWVAGSFLADTRQRSVVQVGLNLLEGTACLARAHQLRCHGVQLPAQGWTFRPRPLRQAA
ncbi:PfaD family polyunsaturated fatty acid/polyketide biosynthesis protein [Streptomyces enissocaesilis]|uniref:PfaD family polyunsaturated fatty acid/polyketide biosynthesis protein n=1 Tax=Streptomyces enissocaesilis TaxID=332589 RepID=A0ABP6J6M2_9ACTN